MTLVRPGTSLYNISFSYVKAGDYAQAKECARKALRVLQANLPPGHGHIHLAEAHARQLESLSLRSASPRLAHPEPRVTDNGFPGFPGSAANLYCHWAATATGAPMYIQMPYNQYGMYPGMMPGMPYSPWQLPPSHMMMRPFGAGPGRMMPRKGPVGPRNAPFMRPGHMAVRPPLTNPAGGFFPSFGPGAPAQNKNDLAAMLANASPEQQKQMLGERLYMLIIPKQPQLAGKITGMLLEGLDSTDLLGIIDSPLVLDEWISLALETLRKDNKA